MSGRLEVVACGAGTTLQDFGRYGFRRYGVALAGAMDRSALARANLLVGNRPDACGIEFSLVGGRFRVVEGPIAVAVGDARAKLSIDGQIVQAFTSALAGAGQIIEIAPLSHGIYAYLAVSGGIDVPQEMDSRSMHRRSGIGGASLREGSILPSMPTSAPRAMRASVSADLAGVANVIRIMRGPQDDLFPDGAFERLLREPYTVDSKSDRMGCRLNGPTLITEPIGSIVSDGVVPGSIQVPGEGLPIVLMRDCQTTGGYPKIATVISADLDLMAQVRPGTAIRFAEVTLEEAVAALRLATQQLTRFHESLRPAEQAPDTELLLSVNLIGGVVDAMRSDLDG